MVDVSISLVSDHKTPIFPLIYILVFYLMFTSSWPTKSKAQIKRFQIKMETHCFYLDLVKLRKAKIMREHIVENRNSNKLKNKTGKKKKKRKRKQTIGE